MAVRDDPTRLPDPQRFGLKHVGADNAQHQPIVIHRAIFGSFERFVALLLEYYAGAFPPLAGPLQVIVLPIADRHLDYAASVESTLAAAGLRVELDPVRRSVIRSGRRSSRKCLHARHRRPRSGRGHRRGPEPDQRRSGRPGTGRVRERCA